MGSDSVPQLETPFLKMTIEDGRDLEHRLRPSRRPRYCRRHPKSPPFRLDQIHCRLPLPDQAETAAVDGMAPESVALDLPAHRRGPRKFHRTEWACPPLREFQPQVGRPFQPLRLRLFRRRRLGSRFMSSPPSSDLRRPAVAAPPVKPAAIAFSADGPRVRLSLRSVLRGFLPFQLSTNRRRAGNSGNRDSVFDH